MCRIITSNDQILAASQPEKGHSPAGVCILIGGGDKPDVEQPGHNAAVFKHGKGGWWGME